MSITRNDIMYVAASRFDAVSSWLREQLGITSCSGMSACSVVKSVTEPCREPAEFPLGFLGYRGWALVILLGVLCFAGTLESRCYAERLYAPDFLWNRGIAEKTVPTEIADAHLGIPYREDGTLDSSGRFTTFASPANYFDAPGLNCSGLVVSVCRYLFDKNWTVEEVCVDRKGDSGPGAALGKDWDFGLDLILNLTEGFPRKPIMPDGRVHSVEEFDGVSSRGFDLHDQRSWKNVLEQMHPGRAYLGSISKLSRKPGYRVLHYHVVMLLPDDKGGLWLYHATQRSNVHRMNIATPRGMARFMSQFTGGRDDQKRIVLIEAALPDASADGNTSAEAPTAPPSSSASTGKEPEQFLPEARVDRPQQARAAVEPESGRKEPADRDSARGNADPPRDRADRSAETVKKKGSGLVINHLVGKVFKPVPEVNTHIPRFADDGQRSLMFWFRNNSPAPRSLNIRIQGPDGVQQFKGSIPPEGSDLTVRYPEDFGKTASGPLRAGEYRADFILDEKTPWLADVFEIAVPREAAPKILRVSAPSTVQAGKTFTVKVEAENEGAESDYGGITISTPDTSGLRFKAATAGKIFPAGSTVLSVTSDRIRTKVPMAERWIELWGEKTTHDLSVKIEAGRPGTYSLYVRCALRGVNVKSSVILMDPTISQIVDQQGFPVYVHQIRVQ